MVSAVGVVDQAEFARQVRQTRRSLDTIDDTSLVDLTHLAADAVRELKQELAEIFPASNLPAFLLQGLIQLEDRAWAERHRGRPITTIPTQWRNVEIVQVG